LFFVSFVFFAVNFLCAFRLRPAFAEAKLHAVRQGSGGSQFQTDAGRPEGSPDGIFDSTPARICS